MAFKLASAFIELTGRDGGLNRVLGSVRGKVSDLVGTLGGMNVAGLAAATAVGLAFTKSIGAALGFEESLAKLNVALRGNQKLLDETRDAVVQLAEEYGLISDEGLRMAAELIRGGASGKEAMEILQSAAQLSRTHFISWEAAIRGVDDALDGFQLGADQTSRVADMLNEAMLNGQTTWEGLTGALGKAAAQAKLAGLEFEDLLAAIDLLTQHGFSTEDAMTQITGLLRGFRNQSDEAAESAKALGIELSAEALQSMTLLELLRKLESATQDQIRAVFGERLGFQALAIMLKDVNNLEEIRGRILNSSGSLQKSYAQATDNSTDSMKRAKAAVHDFFVALGGLLLPALTESIERLSGLLHGVTTVVDFIRNDFVPYLGEAVSAIGFVGDTAIWLRDLWRSISGPVLEVLDLFISAIQEWQLALEVVAIHIDQWALNVRDLFKWLWQAAIQYAIWFSANMFTMLSNLTSNIGTWLLNLGDNVMSFWEGLWAYLTGEADSIDWRWDSLTRGFEQVVGELPSIAKPIFEDIGDEVKALEEEFAKRVGEKAAKRGLKRIGLDPDKPQKDPRTSPDEEEDKKKKVAQQLKIELVGVSDLWKKIQESISGVDKDRKAERMVQKQVAATEKVSTTVASAAREVVAGIQNLNLGYGA